MSDGAPLRATFTCRAMSTAPAVSPWTQIESAVKVMGAPSTSVIGSPVAIATHRRAISSASASTAPGNRRDISVPWGV